MSRPIRARFDGAALRHNLDVARQHAGSSRIWAVVKANAYGHGLARVSRALRDVADGFALIELEGAVSLRDAGIAQPILMLEGFYVPDELPLFARHGLTTVIHDPRQAAQLVASGFSLPVYLKLNTGMNRLGLGSDQVAPVLATLEAAASEVTLMTHFADADGPSGVAGQMACFERIRASHPLPCSLANSAALLRFPGALGDWVRPGIMLYGSSPFPEVSAEALGLRPVMTLESEIIAVRDIGAGDHVGYGSIFTADGPMRIGVVACGYADGYPRHATTGTPILVGGWRTRTVGRVSMDKLCVDLTDLPDAEVGTQVTLWGDGLSADEVAASAGTISYELFCALANRVPVKEVP